MLRVLALFATAFIGACASHLGRPQAPTPLAAPTLGISVEREVRYTPVDWPQALTSDLYTPAGAGPFPAVLMVHGGGWTGRTRADMDAIAATVAAQGYVVMNVSYRLAPAAHFPAQMQDMQQAVLWMRANAAGRKINPGRIGSWGYSAGAQLAALPGLTSPGDAQYREGARVQAVVAGGMPADLRYYPDGPLTNALVGVAYSQNPDLWRDASPLALVTADDPPMFLYHGSLDFTVGDRNAKTMYAALQAAGVPAEFLLIRGLEHFSTFYLDSPVERGIEFLNRHLR